MCVCVREREGARERDGGMEGGREREIVRRVCVCERESVCFRVTFYSLGSVACSSSNNYRLYMMNMRASCSILSLESDWGVCVCMCVCWGAGGRGGVGPGCS